MQKEKISVVYIEKKQEKEALLELAEKEYTVEIKLILKDMIIEKEGDNYFETLLDIRKELEILNIQLLCKGCCKNVYPSGMLLSMGEGRKAYTLSLGEQAKMSSLVDIFSPCSLEEFGTIQQQSDYFDLWTNSLG